MPLSSKSSVKDLVGSYERLNGSSSSSSAAPEAHGENGPSPPRIRRTSRPEGRNDNDKGGDEPPPTPARFLRTHPLLKPTVAAVLDQIKEETSKGSTQPVAPEAPVDELTNVDLNAEITSSGEKSPLLDLELTVVPGTIPPPPSTITVAEAPARHSIDEDDITTVPLLEPKPNRSRIPTRSISPEKDKSSIQKSKKDIWGTTTSITTLPMYQSLPSSLPPPSPASSAPLHASLPQSTSTFYPPHHHGHHSGVSPIPATTLFSRKAVPLSLPELDAYLEKISAPIFSDRSTPGLGGTAGQVGDEKKGLRTSIFKMFSPLEYLVGTTLIDLKYNSKEPAIWKDRNTIASAVINWVIGVTGSSAIAHFYSLQGVYDAIQLFALILTSVVRITDQDVGDNWRKLFLGTIPNVLALNFAPVLTQSIIFLAIFQLISFGLLFYFHRATGHYMLYSPTLQQEEGLLARPEKDRSSGWGILVVSFVLMVLYLPISTIAVHALVWSSDFWPVPNPYVNATSNPLQMEPLGPPSEFRDPLDFCWTTTMKVDSVNWAPLVIIISLFTFGAMTIYFPVRLWQTTKRCLPHVDPYSELGRRRSETELKHEYQRLLARDQNPLSYLYNEYRRAWGTYKSLFLVAKLCTLLVIAIIDPNNCLLRNQDRQRVEVIRQSVLLFTMGLALLAQCLMAPFIDPVANASEWTSRASYFLTSGVGLLVALNVRGKDVFNGVVLYVIYGITYGLNIYFAIVDWGLVQLFIKRISRRIDFSVDIFSPHLDVSSTSHHLKRRIHQETISTLLLATPECRMPKSQKMIYNQSRDCEWPPYLLDFCGSPAERHSENLKILREVGSLEYIKGIEMCYGSQKCRFEAVQDVIETELVGPDAFWRSPDGPQETQRCSNYFGNAWWIPFPPTLVVRYDRGGFAILKTLEHFETFIEQNTDPDVVKRRELRLALRALDGQVAFWPYTHTELVGARSWTPWGGPRYKIQSTTTYESAKFELTKQSTQSWQGIYFGSGFEVKLHYARKVELGGSLIGLDDDFDLTPQLARFLMLNRVSVQRRADMVVSALQDYRQHLRKVSKWKRQVLSYRFLPSIYDCPRPPADTKEIIEEIERDLRVRELFVSFNDAFVASHERMQTVAKSRVATWWYTFWDDFWRRNFRSIGALQTHEIDFNPHYPSSIAYRPLSRPVLESFLRQRGLFNTSSLLPDFIHSGFLNKVYIRLNQLAFRGSSKIVHVHVGDRSTELDLSEIALGSHSRSATMDTGGGTDHDDEQIRARPSYRWEGVYDDPLRKGKRKKRWRPWSKFGIWFGLVPTATTTIRTNGIAFDLKLSQGRYVVMEDDDFDEN
ncbi:hypothetical protein FRC02_004984 [Tulasnella sp. 418]|nr:hypothetical protein FRC02_004984 [Tulasnella sp. 418]